MDLCLRSSNDARVGLLSISATERHRKNKPNKKRPKLLLYVFLPLSRRFHEVICCSSEICDLCDLISTPRSHNITTTRVETTIDPFLFPRHEETLLLQFVSFNGCSLFRRLFTLFFRPDKNLFLTSDPHRHVSEFSTTFLHIFYISFYIFATKRHRKPTKTNQTSPVGGLNSESKVSWSLLLLEGICDFIVTPHLHHIKTTRAETTIHLFLFPPREETLLLSHITAVCLKQFHDIRSTQTCFRSQLVFFARIFCTFVFKLFILMCWFSSNSRNVACLIKTQCFTTPLRIFQSIFTDVVRWDSQILVPWR